MLKKSLIILSIFLYLSILVTGSPFKVDISYNGNDPFFSLDNFNQFVYSKGGSGESSDSGSDESGDSGSYESSDSGSDESSDSGSDESEFASNDENKENSEKNSPDFLSSPEAGTTVDLPLGEDNPPPVGEDNPPPVGEDNNPPPVGEDNNPPPVGEDNNPPPVVVDNKPPPVVEDNNPPPVGEDNNPPPVGEDNNPPPVGEGNPPPVGEGNPEPSKKENNIKDKINLEFKKITKIISKTKTKVIVKDDSDSEKEIIIVSDPTCPTQSETIELNGMIDPKGIRLLAKFYPCIIQNGGITMNIPESPHLNLAVIYIDNNIDNHAGTLISPSKIQSIDKNQGLFSIELDKKMEGNDPITGELTTLEKINGLALYNSGNEPIEFMEGSSVALTATFTK